MTATTPPARRNSHTRTPTPLHKQSTTGTLQGRDRGHQAPGRGTTGRTVRADKRRATFGATYQARQAAITEQRRHRDQARHHRRTHDRRARSRRVGHLWREVRQAVTRAVAAIRSACAVILDNAATQARLLADAFHTAATITAQNGTPA